MKKSGREKAKENGDEVEFEEFTESKNDREAFKDEDRRIQQDPEGAKSENNYNKRDSPGKKYREEDGEN